MSRRYNRILVICTRRIGDVLLATPVVHVLKQTYPDAAVDMLVFAGTQGVLKANANLHDILTIPERPSFREHLRLLARIWRRYDLAVSLLSGDRPTLYAWAAGKTRIGMLEPVAKSHWKRSLLHRWVAFDNLDTHTVTMNLRVLELLDISRITAPVVSWSVQDEEEASAVYPGVMGGRPFAVLHVSPKYAYKTWSKQGWAELASWIDDRGMGLVLVGGNSGDELRYIGELLEVFPRHTVNIAGKVSLGALAYLLSRAAVYVGTDTAVTHMAAALGVPTVALFGPSNPVKWGPWPRDYAEAGSPWRMRGSARVRNVFLVQGEKDCVPCLLEGCDRHLDSLSECLQQLPARRVIGAAEQLLRQQ